MEVITDANWDLNVAATLLPVVMILPSLILSDFRRID